MKECPNCGSPISDDSPCSYCGTPSGRESSTKKDNPATPSRNKPLENSKNSEKLKGVFLGIILTLFTAIVGLVLCLVLGDKKCRIASICTAAVMVAFNILIWCLLIFGPLLI